MMCVIPVIDLKDGQVVHARQGRRDEYRPISSPLCAGSDIFQVIEAFLGIYPFYSVYIADLNALTGSGGHEKGLLAEVLQAYPGIRFWVDRGHITAAEAQRMPGNYWPVLGSESLVDADLPQLADFGGHFVLSLDFFGDQPRGPQVLFDSAAYWPEQVIVMTLGRVGGGQGPDYQRLATYCRDYPNTDFVAAGGVRDCADLQHLKAIGINCALIASALHACSVGGEDIRSLSKD